MSDTLVADGFDEAIIGIGRQFNKQLVIYDEDKCIQILMERDGMSWEEAIEFFNFNVVGAYVGEHTPIFVRVGSHLDKATTTFKEEV
jgi:hypothetical protein